jgi:selenocysteine lyase/cysteine desulfurase
MTKGEESAMQETPPMPDFDVRLQRRQFLVRTGLFLGLAAIPKGKLWAKVEESVSADLRSWDEVRALFNAEKALIHMSAFYLASHPKPVRDAIERYRQALDANPIGYLREYEAKNEAQVLSAAAEYLGANPGDIALTDSTTMGLGLLYGGLTLRPGQEILTTTHDHYSTETSLSHRASRTGASVRRIQLYQNSAEATIPQMVDSLIQAVRPQTRIVAVTWVHSSTGVKIPVKEIAEGLSKINAGRDHADRALLCVDGVHGLGVENVTVADLGCDFFIAGTHKWMFGPRGTGLVWGKTDAWPVANPIIPTFYEPAYEIWMKYRKPEPIPFGATMTPGGFHSFEHRWALDEAFKLHLQIGKNRIAERIHALNSQLKEGLAKTKNVILHTPLSPAVSAGIVCFDVKGMGPIPVVQKLMQKKIVASVTPYATLYARLSPSLLTSAEDVDATLEAVAGLSAH